MSNGKSTRTAAYSELQLRAFRLRDELKPSHIAAQYLEDIDASTP